MKNYIKILIILISIILSSCEKEITVDLPKPEDRIVFEGSIENNQFPILFLTRNTPYFDKVDTNTLNNLIVEDTSAIITVSNGTITDTLTFINFFGYKFYMGTKFKGEFGGTYTLKAYVEGKNYSAVTTIPQPLELDSIRFKYDNPGTADDSTGFLWLYSNDPPELGNYYKVFTRTIGKDDIFVHPRNSVSDDQFFNGQKIVFGVARGYNPNNGEEDSDEDKKPVPRWVFVKGETVIVKFCTLDAKHYDFWYSVELQNNADGNPFAAPVSIKSNIEGGALGVWGGYAASFDTVHIDESIIIE